jgi:ADP-heptose:LPS heptosyltransferase
VAVPAQREALKLLNQLNQLNPLNPLNPRLRLLVIRRDNIGDLACTTPLIDSLRAAHPQAWIGALVNTYNAEVLARNPALDEVVVYEKSKHRARPLFRLAFDRLRLVATLRKQRLDCVLVPAPSPRTLKFARGLRAARVIAAEPGDPRHEVERTWALGASLGVGGAPGPMRVYPDAARVRALREGIGLGPHAAVHPEPHVAVHISARRPSQRWPMERYAELIRALAARSRVMLLWSPGSAADPMHPGDDEQSAHLQSALGGLPFDAVPTPDLATLIAALSLADRVICPDGGAMHLAAALGKPIVALFGDSPVGRWRPWGVPHRVVRPDSCNLADLPVEAVLAADAELARSL